MTQSPMGQAAPGAALWSETLAAAALGLQFVDLPADVVAKAKLCLLDFLSCAFEARDLPWSRQALVLAPALPGGTPMIGSDRQAALPEAAFVNAVLGHGLVREDMHAGSISHHGVVVWPALLALAERDGIDGRTLLAAVVASYEIGGLLGRALFTAELARLFRPTGLTSPVGATLGACRLLGMGRDAAVTAMSLTVNTLGGLNQWPHTGGSEMYFHPGFAVRNLLAAVELARAGAYASPDIVEGEAGLFAAFGRRAAPPPPVLFRDGHFEIRDVYNKPVPACNFAQTACQAALRAARELAGGADTADAIGAADAIAEITIRVTDAARRYPGCDHFGPYARALQAKMSIPFGVAAALARNAIEEANYSRLEDPAILRLIACTRLEEDPAFTAAFPAAQGAEVILRLRDGRRIAHRIADVIPATADEIRDRFLAAARLVIGQAQAAALADAVDRLEQLDDAGAVLRLAAAAQPGKDLRAG